ncbi:MAG: DMT family transporter [Lentisphaerae bacterium]|jgi:drug/metabolite transporter (DMT)-like permease|nr:DMT family transporter [Lentisphaerota bacterium]
MSDHAPARKNANVLGMFALISAIVFFSTIEIVSKDIALKGAQIEPFLMVFLRFFVTGVVLLGFGLPTFFRQGGKLTWEDIKIFLLNGFIGIAVSISLFHAAIIMFSNASSSAVVFSANAVFAIVIARFMNNEPWSVRKWAAVICALLGVSLFIFEKGAPSLDTLKAILTMSLAALGFAYSVCLTRQRVHKYGAMVFMGASSLIGSLFTLPLALWRLPQDFLGEIAKVWPELTYIVLIGTTLAYLLYYIGLKHMSAFIGAMTFFLKPGLACILAWLWKGEQMNAWTISGTLIILAALSLTLPKKRAA